MNLTIPGPIPSKKNNKKIVTIRGKYRIISSQKYRDWHKMAMAAMPRWIQSHSSPVTVQIDFHLPDKRKRDLTNMAESVMDFLVDLRVINDDSWKEVPCLILTFAGIDKENPRAEAWIK